MEQGHEKYVSIGYDKWENYYKPLEKSNKELQSKLDSALAQTRHYHIIRFDRAQGFDEYNYVVIKDGQLEQIHPDLPMALISGASKFCWERGKGTVILTEYGVTKMLGEIREAKAHNMLFQDNFIKWYNTLPKFIKWLFKLKPREQCKS